MYLRTRLRFAGAEGGLRVLQRILNPHCGRMRAPKYAPRDPGHLLHRRHGLAEIVERGAVVSGAVAGDRLNSGTDLLVTRNADTRKIYEPRKPPSAPAKRSN